MVPSGNKGAIFSFLRGACVACVFRRWIERGPSLIVSACASKAVCAWFWVLNGVIHESACVVHASSMRDYARDTHRPSVLMRRDWFDTAHVRPLTPHLHITREQRTNHVHSTDIHCVFGRAPSCVHASGVRRMFMEYYTVFARMCRRARCVSDSSVIVNHMCAVHAWFVSDFCPRLPQRLVNISTHKHAQTQSAWFVSDSCVIGCSTGPYERHGR